MSTIRRIRLAGSASLLRTASFMGKEHLVTPVVALREGVIHAVNAENPEFVPAVELAAVPAGWNGRPVLPLHPVDAMDRQISANTPTVLEQYQFGFVANATYSQKMLKMEAWLDKERAKSLGGDAQRVVERLEAGEPVEVSVGVFVTTEAKEGTYGDQAYKAVWGMLVPDHLAMLPEGTLGACSNEMGCGAPRVAAAKEARKMTMRERVKQLLRGATGTPRTAAEGDTAETVQYGTMQLLIDAVQPAFDAAKQLLADLVADDAIEPTTPEDTAAAEELESARLESFQSYCMEMIGSISGAMQLAYRCNREDYPAYYAMAQHLEDLAGKRNSAKDQEMIQQVHDHATKLGALCNGKVKAAAAGSEPTPPVPCGCTDTHKGEDTMDKATRIAALMACEHNTVKDKAILEALSDQQLDALEAFNKTRAAMVADPKAALADLVTAPRTAAAETTTTPTETPAAKPEEKSATTETAPVTEVSEEEFLKTAPESIRQLVADRKAQDTAEKTDLVTSLKDAQSEYSEEELQAMDLKSIRRLAAVVNVPKRDFSGRGVPRDASAAKADDVFLNPPDPYAAALEARRKAGN